MKRSIEFGLWFAKEREKSGYESQRQLADTVGVSNATIARIESGFIPKPDTLKRLSERMKSTDYAEMMARAGYYEFIDEVLPSSPETKKQLTEKEERDIARDLERMLKDLESNESLAFHGEPMDEESKELLRISLENSMKIAKQVAKRKFTPKKYKK